jgi:hypothetical protein
MILFFSTIALFNANSSVLTFSQRWIVLRYPPAPNPVYGHSVTVQLYNQLAPYKVYTVHCTLYHVSVSSSLAAWDYLILTAANQTDVTPILRSYGVAGWIHLIGVRAMWDGLGSDTTN